MAGCYVAEFIADGQEIDVWFNKQAEWVMQMKRAYEGYYASVRNLLKDADRDQELGACIEGVVAELVQVPKAYETDAARQLLSSLLNYMQSSDFSPRHIVKIETINDLIDK